MSNDYELVYLAQDNNEEAKRILYKKYQNYIFTTVNKMYSYYKFNTIDIEDITLECKLVLENAIDSYNQDKDSKFITYLKSCIETKLTDIIRRNQTYQNKIANNIISLDEEKNGIKLYDSIYDNKSLVDNIYIDIEYIAKRLTTNLSKHEQDLLKLLLQGKNTEEISDILNINIKKTYNTIYRLKNKLKDEIN